MPTLERTRLLAVCSIVSCGIVVGCARSGRADARIERQENSVMADTTIEAAQKELTDSLMTKPGVVGTAIGLCDGEPCIKVYLSRQDDLLRLEIPGTHRGFKVDVEVTGEFRPLDTIP